MKEFTNATLLMKSTAVFSDDMKYRYLLKRVWDESLGLLCGCFMNPSTADQFKNDPTLASWQSRAEKLGYGGFSVVNAFAYRSTDPAGLLTIANPTGPDNDEFILAAAKEAKTFVVGWGQPPKKVQHRCTYVQALLKTAGIELLCLGVNKTDGSPRHPLYTDHTLPFIPWTPR